MTSVYHSLLTSRFNADHINETIKRALASAGLHTSSGPMHGVTETIRRALSSGALPSVGVEDERPLAVVERIGEQISHLDRVEPSSPAGSGGLGLQGRFISSEFSNQAGTRAYKLYVPSQASDSPLPLIVMLHGCTQSADDFAHGTQMNRLAEENRFLVLYPEQAASANASKCWNWFQPRDQERDKGEPSVIAGMVRNVAGTYDVDKRRIFVAGLSAGAAMAVVLGEAYPDIFAAVGSHSGLPFASAHDIPSAMAAMKGGRGRGGAAGATGVQVRQRSCTQAVPTIVFHGDRDYTVQHSNGAAILEQASDAFSRSVQADADGRSYLEFWTLHGAGHAWSGGNASGSFTDCKGPDACEGVAPVKKWRDSARGSQCCSFNCRRRSHSKHSQCAPSFGCCPGLSPVPLFASPATPAGSHSLSIASWQLSPSPGQLPTRDRQRV